MSPTKWRPFCLSLNVLIRWLPGHDIKTFDGALDLQLCWDPLPLTHSLLSFTWFNHAKSALKPVFILNFLLYV